MKTLHTSDDKIQQICDQLRLETLAPARKEAERIIEEAQEQAEQVLHKAREEVKQLHATAKKQIEQERNVFESSLDQSGRMTIEALKQSISEHLFRNELVREVEEITADPEVVAKVLESLISAIEKEGLSTELEAIIPKSVSVEAMINHLTKKAVDRLKKGSVELRDIKGGAEVRLRDQRLTLDMGAKTLEMLLLNYIGTAYRKRLFVEEKV